MAMKTEELKENYCTVPLGNENKSNFCPTSFNLQVLLVMFKLRVLFSVFKLALHSTLISQSTLPSITQGDDLQKNKTKKNLFLFAGLGSLAHSATFKGALFQRMIRVAPLVLIIALNYLYCPESGQCIILKLPFWGMQ